eukprot:CAMPEP_0173148590 /NCGR_PEP_ID=MMETSP1105-20130129/9812_1 /TAXON_ID=2985 /ORGANISM="Ochromonas sp., Strain BG-1" /LENGTH=537 /DNA_ID=CAMNT_0014063277 /DNA_START=92 /DNA_END=1705 /DNA_ORIENTATION=-
MQTSRRRYHEGSTDSDSPLEEGNKRRRIKTNRYEFEFLDNEEQRLIQQAMKISKLETKRTDIEIPDAPVFYPTLEEFKDSLAYIRKIRPEAERYGICKIVPPREWSFPCNISMNHPKKFRTRLQPINTLQQGEGFDDGRNYTIAEYKKMADGFFKEWIDKHHGGVVPPLEVLAKDYWDIVETNTQKVEVEYGNDLDTSKYGSGFPSRPTSIKREENNQSAEDITHPDYYATTSWNLNNMPSAEGSLLRYLQVPINGINVPWLYIGMLFSSFCWHTEDNYFPSINYSHFGTVKQWYGVPKTDANKFEKVTKDFLLGLFRESPDLLHHMTTQVSPSLLSKNGVHVYKAQHEAGTFIVTFPRSYHAGFSYGFNVGEAVNFSILDWIPSGSEALEKYRAVARESAFSTQRLVFTALQNKEDFKHDRRKLYQEIAKIIQDELNGRAIAISKGVRELADIIQLRPNNFETFDEKAIEYDEMRICCLCKQSCLFTAVACECDRSKVSCLIHFQHMCKCPNNRRFLLNWGTDEDLKLHIKSATKN